MSVIEAGVLSFLSVAVDGLSALSATGVRSLGVYGGYAAGSPASSTVRSDYSWTDKANLANFMDAIRQPTVQCRPGNPYC